MRLLVFTCVGVVRLCVNMFVRLCESGAVCLCVDMFMRDCVNLSVYGSVTCVYAWYVFMYVFVCMLICVHMYVVCVCVSLSLSMYMYEFMSDKHFKGFSPFMSMEDTPRVKWAIS